MTVDVEMLKDFFNKLEWEGGYVELIDYGIEGSTGDAVMDSYLEHLEAALDACRSREKFLWNKYGEQLEEEDEV